MIIVLKPHTSDEGIEKIKNLIVAKELNHMYLKGIFKQSLEW